MFNSVQPHRWQPTRISHPWDSPGKNNGVDCHFLLQCMKVKGESEVAQSCLTLCDLMDCSLPGSSIHGIFQARVLEWVPLPSPEEAAIMIQLFTEMKRQNSVHIIFLSSFIETYLFYSHKSSYRQSFLLCPWDFPGKSTGVGCHCLLQFYSASNFQIHNTILFTAVTMLCLTVP